MHPILSAISSVASLKFRSRTSLELEIVALRHQLGVLRRRQSKKITFLSNLDRVFWVLLYRTWPRIIDSMVIVKPRSVIRWHYTGFRLFWRWKSRHVSHEPLKVGPELKDLIHQMKRDNPLWGLRRIEGELRKLGFDISHKTVRKYLPQRYYSPSPGWRAFLYNHLHHTAAVDFMVVVTAKFDLLYAMIVIGHSRRRIIHYAVTEHPTQEWAAEQIELALSRHPKPKYLIRDRDKIYGVRFKAKLKKLNIKEKVTMRQSPWQNIFVERVNWSIRHECLDHVIVLSQKHLERILGDYVSYYNHSRTHSALDQDCPVPRRIDREIRGKKIVAIPEVGGLHHRYERRAA